MSLKKCVFSSVSSGTDTEGSWGKMFWFFFPSCSLGPWFIGELIDGHSGACFAFGVFIDGHFLEGSLTYVVGVVQVRKAAFCYCFFLSIQTASPDHEK